LPPPIRSGLGHPCLDAGAHSRRSTVEGRQEAVFLVVELLVEGRSRDARPGEHVLHGQRVVADFPDRLDHRRQQALALHRLHQVGG
jgi:hypothetical protein